MVLLGLEPDLTEPPRIPQAVASDPAKCRDVPVVYVHLPLLVIVNSSWEWWCTALIPAFRESETEGLQV